MIGKLKINKLCCPEIVKLRNPFLERWGNILVFELCWVLGSVALTEEKKKTKITIIWTDISPLVNYIFFILLKERNIFSDHGSKVTRVQQKKIVVFLDNKGPLTAKQVMTDIQNYGASQIAW